MALITVIVPNYNHGRFLKQRIESILQQTFSDFQLIILDDCSTDNSRDILELYSNHPKVKSIIFNEVNSGSPFRQWQKGLALADTEWVWIAESDDTCKPDFLLCLKPAFESENCVLAYNEIEWVNDKLENIKELRFSATGMINGRTFLRSCMFNEDWLVNAGMVVFRKSAALKVAPGWQNMKLAGDYWFWCEIARQGLVFSSGKSMAYFIRHEGTVSSKWLETETHFLENLQVLDLMCSNQIVTAFKLRNYIRSKLIDLEIGRVNISRESFITTSDFWLGEAKKRGHIIFKFEIKLLGNWRKLMHLLRRLKS